MRIGVVGLIWIEASYDGIAINAFASKCTTKYHCPFMKLPF